MLTVHMPRYSVQSRLESLPMDLPVVEVISFREAQLLHQDANLAQLRSEKIEPLCCSGGPPFPDSDCSKNKSNSTSKNGEPKLGLTFEIRLRCSSSHSGADLL